MSYVLIGVLPRRPDLERWFDLDLNATPHLDYEAELQKGGFKTFQYGEGRRGETVLHVLFQNEHYENPLASKHIAELGGVLSNAFGDNELGTVMALVRASDRKAALAAYARLARRSADPIRWKNGLITAKQRELIERLSDRSVEAELATDLGMVAESYTKGDASRTIERLKAAQGW